MEQETGAQPYAIFETGGKQYQAVVGKTVAIEKLAESAGQKVSFENVLLRKTFNAGGQAIVEIGRPFLKSPISASIIKHARAPKITVFHLKRRKKYKRKAGHRQPYTVVRIETI